MLLRLRVIAGIGEAAAKLFAKEGCKVVVSDLDPAKSDKVAADINTAGGVAISVCYFSSLIFIYRAIIAVFIDPIHARGSSSIPSPPLWTDQVPGDVTDAKWPALVVAKTVEAFGKINFVINNAGYTWDGLLNKMSDKQWDAMLAVHQTAPFRLIRCEIIHIQKQLITPRFVSLQLSIEHVFGFDDSCMMYCSFISSALPRRTCATPARRRSRRARSRRTAASSTCVRKIPGF